MDSVGRDGPTAEIANLINQLIDRGGSTLLRAAVRSAFQAGFVCFDVWAVGAHREHRFDRRVVEIAKPREWTNFCDVQFSVAVNNVVANVHADDAANDDMMNLIESMSWQRQRALESALEVHG